MLKFDQDKSQKLDEDILTIFTNLMNEQKLAKQPTEKTNFISNERKLVYDLFVRVNEERQV